MLHTFLNYAVVENADIEKHLIAALKKDCDKNPDAGRFLKKALEIGAVAFINAMNKEIEECDDSNMHVARNRRGINADRLRVAKGKKIAAIKLGNELGFDYE